MQFNAYFGCSWCYQIGEQLLGLIGPRYTVQQIRDERTHKSHLQDIKDCVQKNSVTRGVKGDTVLKDLPCVDLVWIFGYDYMHTLALGKSR